MCCTHKICTQLVFVHRTKSWDNKCLNNFCCCYCWLLLIFIVTVLPCFVVTLEIYTYISIWFSSLFHRLSSQYEMFAIYTLVKVCCEAITRFIYINLLVKYVRICTIEYFCSAIVFDFICQISEWGGFALWI